MRLLLRILSINFIFQIRVRSLDISQMLGPVRKNREVDTWLCLLLNEMSVVIIIAMSTVMVEEGFEREYFSISISVWL